MPTRPPRAYANGQAPKPRPAKPRASAAQRGYDSKWREARLGFLAKHPRCECPEHKGKPNAPPATVVHHDPPHRGDKVAFWTRSTWFAWAKPCHDRRTSSHDGGWGNRRREGTSA